VTAFWTGLGGELSKHWITKILTPAFAFWLGALAAIWWHTHAAGVAENGWGAELSATAAAIESLSGLNQALLVVGGLLAVTGSAVVVERLTTPAMRFLEGYWRRPRRLRAWLVGRHVDRRRHWKSTVDELALRQRLGTLSVAEFLELEDPTTPPARKTVLRRARATGFDAAMAAELSRGQSILRRTPRQDAMIMPTRLGNILRAAERRPLEKYGLDAVVCWYALWQVLPDALRTDLTTARSTMDKAVRLWLWGLLFVVWTPFTWWSLAVAVLVPAATYTGSMLAAARGFGEWTVTAFDLHRFALYDGLRVPRPVTPEQERQVTGPLVTDLLWGGSDDPKLTYADPPEK
jgi:hypothetical protein